jgi:large subunit ribosomal protein L9
MKVILREDVAKLGRFGEVVDVKPGYARNYLLPRQLAFLCTKEAEQRIQSEKKLRAVREAKQREELIEVAERLNGMSITISARAEEERLYGSVGAKEIAEAIAAEHKVLIHESAVKIDAPFKALGTPDVLLRLAEGAEATIKVWIVAESD